MVNLSGGSAPPKERTRRARPAAFVGTFTEWLLRQPPRRDVNDARAELIYLIRSCPDWPGGRSKLAAQVEYIERRLHAKLDPGQARWLIAELHRARHEWRLARAGLREVPA